MNQRRRWMLALVELSNQKRTPVISHRAQYADAGAIFAYGVSLGDRIRRSAFAVDKILRGAKPAAIPGEQATCSSWRST